jgi:two-component system sensor histidine kinase KdpD
VVVVRSVVGGRRRLRGDGIFQSRAPLMDYWYVAWTVAGFCLASVPLEELLGYRSVGLFFLTGLLALSLFYSAGPLALAALLSAMAWDFLFIPPRFTWVISQGEDVLLIVAYFVAAAIGGVLTWRLRRSRGILEERETRMRLLYELGGILDQPGVTHQERFRRLAQRLESALGLQVTLHLLMPDRSPDPQGFGADQTPLDAKELAVADWALRHGRPAGWSTPNLPSAGRLMLPLLGIHGSLGFLACRPVAGRGGTLSFEQEQLLQAAAQRLAQSLEQALLRREAGQAELLKESERLHQALLDSVSHELRTPLTALLGSAAGLAAAGSPDQQVLVGEINAAGERLNRVIDNLLDMARLSSGALALNLDWQDPAELVAMTVRGLARPLSRHRVVLDLPEQLPLLRLDFRLMEHVLSNLLLNAAAYAPEGTEIQVSARVQAGRLELRVRDQGPGIPVAERERIFEKFHRLPGSPAGGTGLGLNIARSLVQAHHGELSVEDTPGGACFLLSLPLDAQPQEPQP